MKKPFVLLWTLVAGLFLFFWVYLPSLSKYRDLKARQEELQRQIETLEVKVKFIKEERDLLKNDVSYLEKVIRDELGLVKPGEIVYKFVSEEVPAPVPVSSGIKTGEAGKTAAPAAAKAETAVSAKTQEAVKAAAKQGIEVVAKPIPKKTVSKPKTAVKTAPKKAAASSAEPSYPRQETR